jgi:ABC-type glycerol-3-phosphate transport system substrate-binding protein
LVKLSRSLLSAFCVLLFISACAPPLETATPPNVTREANATATAAATSVPVSTLGVEAESLRGVVIMAWHPWFGVEASLFETQVADFNATNEWGISVLSVGQSNYAELFNNVTASLAAPDKPNLAIGLPEHALFWNERNGVTDLAPYVSDPIWGMSADEIADFAPVFWEQDLADGRRLGMPAQRTARLIYYNVSWARELGFDAPPASTDEFREQACAATASFRANEDPTDDALGGWLVDTDPMTALGWMLAFGGGVQEGEGYRFLRPENIEAFGFTKKLFEDGCAFQLAETTPIDAFANRRALFVTGGLEDLAAQSRALLTLSSNDEWTLIPFPGETETMAVYGSSYIVLTADDAEQLASWLFVRWMLSSENQSRWVSTMGMFPLRASTLDLVAEYAASHPQWVGAVKLLPQAQGTPRLASWRQIRLVLGDGFDFMFRVNMPVGQVAVILADMDRAVEDLTK